MIIDFIYGQGGGSGSGVTPEEVQEQINSALTPYTPTSGFSTINGSAITEGEAIVIDEPDLSGYWTSAQTQSALDVKQDVIADLDSIRSGAQAGSTAVQPAALADYVDNTELQSTLAGYYTSAQTEEAISAATSGKADAANVSPNAGGLVIPNWNTQGIINGEAKRLYNPDSFINGKRKAFVDTNGNGSFGSIYAPESAGTAGDILVSTGNGAPVWSAVTFISSADVQSQIDTKAADYTPTTGFSTINGSAITNGGNIVIEGGGDLSNYWDSAQTQAHIDSAYTSATTHIEDVERVTAAALNELHSEVDAISGASENYITSAYVNTALASYTPTSGFSTINGSAITAGGNLVIEGGSGSANIIELTKAEYNALSAYTEDAIYVITDADAINMDDYATSANVNTALASYTPTSGFSTINGSAITAGGNLVIEGGGDLSAYWTSAQTQTAITTATANMVTSTTVTNIWRGTQAQYDLIDPKDPNALYIILAS